MAPKIVRAESVPGNYHAWYGWDENGRRYVLKRWGAFAPVYVYTNGGYSENLGEIPFGDLYERLGL